MSPALIAVVITALAVVVGAAVFGRSASRGVPTSGAARPWWGALGPWAAASVAFLLLGVYVFPRLFGFVVLLLPLIWMRRGNRPSGWKARPGDREEP